MAEGVRFELTRPFGLPVFKTGAINRSATPPVLAGGVDAGPAVIRLRLGSANKPAGGYNVPSAACWASVQSLNFLPVGTVPSEKFLEAIDITPVKIDKVFSFTPGHLSRVRRRTGFYII
jgi:hypothetical protein